MMSETSDDQTANVGTAVTAPRAGPFVRDALAWDAPLLLLAAMALITSLGAAMMSATAAAVLAGGALLALPGKGEAGENTALSTAESSTLSEG